MPIVSISMLEGRSDEQKELMINEVSEAIARSLDAPKESVRVLIYEMPPQHFGIGGQSAKKLGKQSRSFEKPPMGGFFISES